MEGESSLNWIKLLPDFHTTFSFVLKRVGSGRNRVKTSSNFSSTIPCFNPSSSNAVFEVRDRSFLWDGGRGWWDLGGGGTRKKRGFEGGGIPQQKRRKGGIGRNSEVTIVEIFPLYSGNMAPGHSCLPVHHHLPYQQTPSEGRYPDD